MASAGARKPPIESAKATPVVSDPELEQIPVFDEERLDAAVGTLPVAQALEMIGLVPEEASRQIAVFDEAIEQEDLAAARRAAHSLKGLAANFGTARLEAVGRRAELACTGLDEARSAHVVVHQALEATRDVLPEVMRNFESTAAKTTVGGESD